jgi:hypothetical protein
MDVLGGGLGAFIGVTVVVFGFAACAMGQALARGWRPPWHILPYALLLAAGARFITFALFGGPLFAPLAYILAVIVMLLIGSFGYQVTRARRMVMQYPWLYERAGLFGWRDKPNPQ